MTLQCQCGGALEMTSQSYGQNSYERYECASCRETGSYRFGDKTETTGCVVIA